MTYHFFTFIYDGIAYDDRLSMSIEESKLLNNYTIITSKSHFEHDNLILIKSTSYIDFCFKSLKFIKKNYSSRTNLIFNEHNSFLILLLSILRFHNVLKIYNLYSLDTQFFLESGWNSDPNSKLSNKHNLISFKNSFKSFIERVLAIWSCDFILSNNPKISKEFLFSKRKYFFVNSSFSLEKYNSIKIEKSDFKFDNDYKYLLYVGNIKPEKGIATLIKSYSKLKSMGKFKLILIGKSSEIEIQWLNKLLQQYNVNDVIYLGKLKYNQLKFYYKNCNIFILPSFYEGSPRVLKEAMYFPINITASRIDGNTVLDAKEERIKFFTKGDSSELTQTILNFSDSNYVQSKYILDKFDSNIIAKNRIKIYKNEFIT